MTEVRIAAEAYTVTIWPEDIECGHADLWRLTVVRREHGRWAVLRGGVLSRVCLAVDGRWDTEPAPAGRNTTWLDDHRFDMDTALDLARTYAPIVAVDGVAAIQVLDSHEKVCRG